MTLPFANGQTQPQETRIAEAIVERLMLLHRDNGLFLAHVGEAPVMPSRISDRESWDNLVREMKTRAPAVLVVIDSAKTAPGPMDVERTNWRRTYDVTLAVFSNHRRDLVLGRLNPDGASQADDTKDPGIRAVCELIDALLLGFSLDLEDVSDLEPGRAGMQTVYAGALGTLRELHYLVEAEMNRTSWPDVATYLDTIETSLATSAGFEMQMETKVSP